MAGEAQFGAWLRRKLLERQLSLAQLCRAVGCDYTYLWRILHADTARGRRYLRPSYSLTLRLGEALDAPTEALVAAGYHPTATPEEARVADRLARLERDLEALRESLRPVPAAEMGRRLPLLGRVPAGDLREALEHPEAWIELPDLVGRDAAFVLRVLGDSMLPTLQEGDLVAVRPQPSAIPGELVVASVDGDVTLKRYDVVDGVPMLVADNPDWKPIRCGPRVRIVGVVTGCFRPADVLLRRPRQRATGAEER